MDFTFGIITEKNNEENIKTIIESIHTLNIPNYEIIIIGDCNLEDKNLRIFPFNETIKKGWITKKKNLICQRATYENIVLLHDYIKFDPDWYKGFLEFGNTFQICITKINTISGKRFRDYTLYPWGIEPHFQQRCLVPYSQDLPNHIRRLLYVSGSYYIIKKAIALQFPLEELLGYGQGEDVEYSKRLALNNIFISCNKYSTVHLMKHKEQCNWESEMTSNEINDLLNINESYSNTLFNNQYSFLKTWLIKNYNIILPS
jgi:hypothetical protein